MGVIRRQSAFSSIALYSGIALGFVLSLFVYPRFLKAEEIGLVRVLVDMAKLVSPFLLLGVPNTFVRYYPFFKKNPAAEGAFRYLSLVVSGIGTLVALTLFFAFEPWILQSFVKNSPLLGEFFGWLPVLIFLVGGIALLRAYFRSDYNITIPNVYEAVVLKGYFIVSVLLYYYLELGVEWLIYFYILSHGLVFAGLLVSYIRRGNVGLSRDLSALDPGLRKEMVYYGLFVIANMVSGSMIVNIDIWMLASLSGLSATGIYAIALSIGMVIELPRRSITQIAVPVIATSWKNGNMENIKDIYHKTSLNQLLAGGVLFILVWTNVDDLFHIIPNGEVYSDGKWVVFFIGMSKLFSIATGCNIEILQVSEHYRYSLWTRIVLIVTAILTNLYFIPLHGITGAAIATMITFVTNNVVLYLVVLVKLRMQPFQWSNAIAVAWLVAIYALVVIVPIDFDWKFLNIAARSGLIVSVFALILWKFHISKDLREYMVMALKKVGIRR